MKYMGSKRRVAKKILPIILEGRKKGQCYVEPFVGGGNSFELVENPRVGADSNEHAIKALSLIARGGVPSDGSEFCEYDYIEARKKARAGESLTDAESYALIALSFSGKWCGGWARARKSDGSPRDFVAEQCRAAIKQQKLLQGAKLVNSSYKDLDIPPQSIIYCDPPYEGVTGYKGKFDHDEFWQWCRDKAAEGHTVFISEYSAPDDFECVWQQELKATVAKDGKQKKAIEKLFKVNL